MEFDYLEFYPQFISEEKKEIIGSLALYLKESSLYLQGIRVHKKKDKWAIYLPQKISYSTKTQKIVVYPVLSYKDKEKEKQFKQTICDGLDSFVERRIRELQISYPLDLRGLVSLKKKMNQEEKVKKLKETKPAKPVEKPVFTLPKPGLKWVDLPKKKK